MKTYIKDFLSPLCLFALLLCYSCGPKSEADHDLSADSLAYQDTEPEVPLFSWSDSVHSGNAVRVELDSSKAFDWTSFRARYHQAEDGSEEFSDELAVGPWVHWNEFQYRRVYRLVDDGLWIQTFYRAGDSTQIQSGQGTPVMDSQDPGYVQFGPLWSDMLTRGHHLSDSLK